MALVPAKCPQCGGNIEADDPLGVFRTVNHLVVLLSQHGEDTGDQRRTVCLTSSSSLVKRFFADLGDMI